MTFNTLKTVFGYLMTLFRKVLPERVQPQASSLEGIYNYLKISDRISTSGQPSEVQFPLIKSAGFTTVINLAPHSAENALQDEAGLLASLQLRYVHIPVDFSNPTDADFAAFCDAMADVGEEKVWVHCAANMRVSAFLFRYRCRELPDSEPQARKDLLRIWEPFGVWKKFIA